MDTLFISWFYFFFLMLQLYVHNSKTKPDLDFVLKSQENHLQLINIKGKWYVSPSTLQIGGGSKIL